MKSISKSSVHRAGIQRKIARCILIAAGITALGSRVGRCDAYFYARAGTNSAVEGWTPVSAPPFVRSDVVWTEGTRLLSASAIAGPGVLAVSTKATVNIKTIYATTGLREERVNASAEFDLYDVIISQIPGSNGVPDPDGKVSASLNLNVSGAINAHAEASAEGGRASSLAFASVRVYAVFRRDAVYYRFGGEIGANMGADTGPPPPGPLVVERTGMLSGFTGDNVVQTGVTHLPTNVEITVALSLATTGAFNWQIPSTDTEHTMLSLADGLSDFSHVGFPSTGPVFNLPDGFTVNSECGLIVNNQYQPGLMIAAGGTNAVVTWLASPGAVVHCTENLSPPVQWTEVTDIVAMGRTNMLTLDSSSGKKFFRLTR